MTAFSPRRKEMLPPLPSTYCRCQSFRPTATISALAASASGEAKSFAGADPGEATGAPEGAPSPRTAHPCRRIRSRAVGVTIARGQSTSSVAPAATAASTSRADTTF